MTVDAALLQRLLPEGRLLMLAAGPKENDALIAELLARESIDWPRLFALAEIERASAVLWDRLRNFRDLSISPTSLEVFERRTLVGEFTAKVLESRLGDTLLVLRQAGIASVLLKGAALATTVFRGFADRPMGDVDILIEERRVEESWRLARRTGWIWDETAHPLSNYVGHHHLPPLVGPAGMDVKLEIHAALFVHGHPFAIKRDDLVHLGQTVRVGAGEAIAPDPENLLLHAAMHFAWSHMMSFGYWRAIRDVRALVPHIGDWDEFLVRSERNRANSVCFWTLHLARALCGAAVPQEVTKRLGRGFSERRIKTLSSHFAGDALPGPNACPSAALRRWMWEQAIEPRAQGHGKIRPWTLDDSLMEGGNGNGEIRPGLIGRSFRHFGRLGEWTRYLRSVWG